jgi:UDP-N-acetyl-D-mannosaminuronic acid dehydrogenase
MSGDGALDGLADEQRVGLYRSDLAPSAQRAALTGGEVPVAVYGLGKMGLPLAAVYAEVTGAVVGVDVDPAVVAELADGGCPVANEPGLAELVSRTVERGALTATTDPEAAASRARVHVVIVPTLVSESDEPDLSTLRAATEAVGAGLEPGDTVVVESTVPPGTCREVVAPALTRESGLSPDSFGLAFCPERTASGRALTDIRESYPKVVGGVDGESRRVAELVYGEITDNSVIPVADATTAECVKLFEGVYRDVNIALANELSRLGTELGVDVREAIEVANTQPFCDIHDPGPGVGGHCIPYYPYFLINWCETAFPLLERARAVNDGMPSVAVERLATELAAVGETLDGATVALLGVTYRPGVDETRASPAIAVCEHLRERGATVLAVDPVCSDMSVVDADPVSLSELPARDPDAVVVLTPQEAFDSIRWAELDPTVVLDTRDALEGAGPHRLATLGKSSR